MCASGRVDCNILQYTAIYCNILQYTAIHCKNTATHCNILQYTALHCTACLTSPFRTFQPINCRRSAAAAAAAAAGPRQPISPISPISPITPPAEHFTTAEMSRIASIDFHRRFVFVEKIFFLKKFLWGVLAEGPRK